MSYPATRIRQPGGVRVKCEQGYGQTCDCGLFNNYGMPQVVTVGFSGFGSCSTTCGALNNAIDDPDTGTGPFACQYQSLTNTIPNAAGGHEINGLFCQWGSDPNNPVNVNDAVANQSTGVLVFFAIGISDTGDGVCAAIWVQGTHSLQNYFVWTWTNLPITPGLLGCANETQVPLAYTLGDLLSKNPQTSWEWNGSPPAPDGRPWLCANCPTLMPAWAEALPVGNGATCDGSGQTAPPCCCGGPTSGPCFFLCLECGTGYCGMGLCPNGHGQWTGDDKNCELTATLSLSDGQWTISWSGADCSGSHTFAPSEVTTNPFALISADGNIAVTTGSASGHCAADMASCSCGDGAPYDGNAPPAVDVDIDGVWFASVGVSNFGGCDDSCINACGDCLDCVACAATCELVQTMIGGTCASYQFIRALPLNKCHGDTNLVINAWLAPSQNGCIWCANAGFSPSFALPWYVGQYCSDLFTAADSPTTVILKATPGAGCWPCGAPSEIRLEVLT